MRKIMILWVVLILFCTQLWPLVALAETSSVVIVDIGASEKTDHEWIKIFNRGSEAVDLTGWKFYEDKTNHKLTLFRGDSFVIAAGQYVVIAQVAQNYVADYPDFTGTILDSSWSSLSEPGEEIGLKNSSGAVQELFVYIAVNGLILERIDPIVDDYTASNWRTKTSTPDPLLPQDGDNTNPIVSADPNSGQVEVCQNLDLKINEFVASPADEQEEFIELYNNGIQPIDLAAWSVEDGSKRVTTLIGEVESGNFFVVDKPKGVLNNTGDTIVLRCGDKIVDQVTYGEWNDGDANDNVAAPEDPYSAARVVDGQDSDIDNIDWQVTTQITRGAANIVIAPPPPPQSGRTVVVTKNSPSSEGEETTVATENSSAVTAIEKIVINELFPNPIGSDREKEFIELKNIGEASVDLVDWTIGSTSFSYKIKKDDLVNTEILAGGTLVVPRKISNFSLKNQGKMEVLLKNQAGKIIDSVEYLAKGIEEDWSYSRFTSGWQWTLALTSGQENVLAKPSLAPIASLALIKKSRPKVGENIIFDATDSTDPDGDTLDYRWDFGDSNYGNSEIVEYAYTAPGKYEIVLTVDDGRGKSDVVKKKITLYPAPAEEKDESEIEIAGIKTSGGQKANVINVGKLVKTSGEIIEKNGQKIWLDNNGEESLVYISKTTGIKMSSFSLGQKLEITGLVKKYQDEYRICPRDKNDIVFIVNEPQVLGVETTKNDGWVKWLLIGGMIVAAVVVAIIIKIKYQKAK